MDHYNSICALWFLHHQQLGCVWIIHSWAHTSVRDEERRNHAMQKLLPSGLLCLGDAHAKDPLRRKYMLWSKTNLNSFKTYEIAHVSRGHNTRTYGLSKLGGTSMTHINHYFIQETLKSLSLSTTVVVDAVTHGAKKPT